MQSLTIPTGEHNPNGHTADEVLAALRFESGSRYVDFRYELLDSTNAFLQELDNVLSCSVEQNWLADVKRTARFSLLDDGVINFLSDRIRPWVRLHLPPYGDDDWVEWPLGTFLLSSPKRSIDAAGVVTRDVEAYDLCQLFLDDKTTARYAVSATTTVAEDFEDTIYTVPLGGSWARATDQKHAGSYSLKSATIGDNGVTDATMVVPVGATSMTAWYKVSSESGYDKFDILVNGASQSILASGEVAWTQATIAVSGGQVITFRYAKDNSQLEGSDAAWVDDVSFIGATTRYTDAVVTLLGSDVDIAVVPASAGLTTTLEWDPGTPKLRIINDLLAAAGYNSLSFDELGTAVAAPYVLPSSRAAEYVYADDVQSVMLPAVDQEMDLFGVANTWIVSMSRPDKTALTSTYVNNDPASLTSTVSRGRTITDFRQVQDAADQATLDAMAARIAFEASQVYEVVDFTTALMPIHSGNDVYQLQVSGLAVDAKYAEHSWSTELKEGALMKHKARRVVKV